MRFDEIDLKPEIHRALESMGYTELTPVQEQTLPPILENRDILAFAETGSGKTSACGIPLVQRIDPSNRNVQVLIMVPTRELALQYVDEIGHIAQYLDISPFAVYGGFDMDIQRAKLRDGVHVLVATPGRLIDHLCNAELSVSEVMTLVLDEADEMLNMGFIDDIKFVMSCILAEHQTLLFSATMPRDIEDLATSYLRNPVKIELSRESAVPESLSHHFKHLSPPQRLSFLKSYLNDPAVKQAIVFCNSRQNGERLFGQLKNEYESLDYIQGGLSQSRRTSIFNRFKRGAVRLLIATDVAARGLDFTNVTHVINYDFPTSAETYINRTGRAGRMGRVGTAITLVTRRDLRSLEIILRENHIEPMWDGKAPDMSQSRRAGSDRKRSKLADTRRPRRKKQRGTPTPSS